MVRCCCCCCCTCNNCGRLGQQKEQPGYKLRSARWLASIKLLALLLVAGVAAGAALGMATGVNPHLVDSGLATLGTVKARSPRVSSLLKCTP